MCHLQAGEVNGRQRWPHRFMLERNARRSGRNGQAIPGASGCDPRSGTAPLPGCRGTGRVVSRGPDRSRRPRNLDHYSGGTNVFGSNGGQAGHPCDCRRALLEFLERVTGVNQNPDFLAKVTRVVLFGSMLKLKVDRLSDLDVAVELARKETRFRVSTGAESATGQGVGQQGLPLPEFFGMGGLLVLGGVPIPEGAKSRDRLGRLQKRLSCWRFRIDS